MLTFMEEELQINWPHLTTAPCGAAIHHRYCCSSTLLPITTASLPPPFITTTASSPPSIMARLLRPESFSLLSRQVLAEYSRFFRLVAQSSRLYLTNQRCCTYTPVVRGCHVLFVFLGATLLETYVGYTTILLYWTILAHGSICLDQSSYYVSGTSITRLFGIFLHNFHIAHANLILHSSQYSTIHKKPQTPNSPRTTASFPTITNPSWSYLPFRDSHPQKPDCLLASIQLASLCSQERE